MYSLSFADTYFYFQAENVGINTFLSKFVTILLNFSKKIEF
jgi:hypothetical protein